LMEGINILSRNYSPTWTGRNLSKPGAENIPIGIQTA
jgi:hypothetical protein